MSDNNSSNYENKLNELREAQNSSETQHHVDTKQILSNTWKTNRILTLAACCAAVTIALLLASGCNVTTASERQGNRRLENSTSNMRRVVERAIWTSEACGRRMETGRVVQREDVAIFAKQIVTHPQFHWGLKFMHPIFRGHTIGGLAESDTIIGEELRKLRDAGK